MKTLLIAIILLAAAPCFAADVYFGSTSLGSNNGTSCANRYAWNDATNGFNQTTNNKWVAGNILHLCDVIVGASGSTLISAQGNGTIGSSITVKFETGAGIQAPYFSQTNGAINLTSASYIIVDGGTPCGAVALTCNGFIQATLNGTAGASCPGGACSNQQFTAAIQAQNCAGCEVKNIEIKNLYNHTLTTDNVFDTQQVNCIVFSGGNVGFLLHDSKFSDGGWCVSEAYSYANDANIQVYNNDISRVSHGIIVSGGLFTLSSFKMYGNHIHDMANWETTNDAYHLTGLHVYNTSGGKTQNIYIYDNLFDGTLGGSCCTTGWIYLEGGAGSAWTDSTGTSYIYNNVISAASDADNPFGVVNIGGGTGHLFVNNVVAGPAGGAGACVQWSNTTANITFENNVVAGCNEILGADYAVSITYTSVDYNVYGQASGGSPIWKLGAITSNTFSGWKIACSCDAHSSAASPLSSALSNFNTTTGVPTGGFVGIGAATNLTALGISTLNSDKAGTARPAVAAWDVGAYQFSSAPATAVAPAASMFAMIESPR